MPDDLKTLISIVGDQDVRITLESKIMLSSTSRLDVYKDKNIQDFEFNGSTLLPVITIIEKSFDYIWNASIKDAVEILKLMEKYKDSVLMKRADYIVVFQSGFTILRFRNVAEPRSGTYISLEINSFRKEFADIAHRAQFRFGMICTVLTLYGIFILKMMK